MRGKKRKRYPLDSPVPSQMISPISISQSRLCMRTCVAPSTTSTCCNSVARKEKKEISSRFSRPLPDDIPHLDIPKPALHANLRRPLDHFDLLQFGFEERKERDILSILPSPPR